jgi:cobalt-zinc-cadmium efflux system outer membrane protein
VPQRTLSRDGYIREVIESNLTLAAERTNVPIAQAQISVARILPDPALSVGITSLDVSRVGAQNSVAVGLSVPLEWPGRQGARVDVSMLERQSAEAVLDDALRIMRSSAALAFIAALEAKMQLVVARQSLDSLERFVLANQVRLRAGDIGEVPLIQARVEAERYRADVLTAEGDANARAVALRGYLGPQAPSALRIDPSGDLREAPLTVHDDALVARALSERADIRAQRLSQAASSARIRLTRVNRGVDVVLGLGWQFFFAGEQGSAFQAPPYHTVFANVTVPLPISRLNRGLMDSAVSTAEQAQLRTSALEVQIENEVRQAIVRYSASLAALDVYDRGLLQDSARVLEAILYAYQRGGATLLEVLSAQRTLDDVRSAFVTALANVSRARIALAAAVGSAYPL